MKRRLASVALVPMKRGQAQLVELLPGTVVVGVGYTGGASVQLLLEVPIAGSPGWETRSFQRFEIGGEIPDQGHYHYTGYVQAGPTTVFVYERTKP